MVIGTSGFDLDGLREAAASSDAKAFFAPNFAIGAVLMMKFAAEASRVMERAEIIELHHPAKLDAPSGTAARTARDDGAATSRSTPSGCRASSPTRRSSSATWPRR